MNNDELKNIILLALENRQLIGSILQETDPGLIKKNILAITEHEVNVVLQPYIMSLSPMITSYHVMFQGGKILADIGVRVPKVGTEIGLSYAFQVSELKFDAAVRMVNMEYKESVKTENPLAKMAISALGLGGGTLLQKGLSHFAKDAAYVTGDRISLNIAAFDFSKKVPKELTLSYAGADNGMLKLGFFLE